MAIGITFHTQLNDTVDRASYTTASVTPGANRWLVLDNFSRFASSPITPAVSGLSLSWINEHSIAFDTGGSFVRMTRFYAWTGSAPGSGTITLNYSPDTQTVAAWIAYEITGANESDPFVQSNSQKDVDVGATSVQVTLTAFAKGTNRPLIAAYHNVNEASTPDTTPSVYTEIGDVSGSAPVGGFAAAWNSTDTDTTPSYSWTTSSALFAAIASEIDEGAGAGVSSVNPMGMMGFFGS